METKLELIKKIQELIDLATEIVNTGDPNSDPHWVNEELFVEFKISGLSILEKIYGKESPYYKEFQISVVNNISNQTYRGRGILTTILKELNSRKIIAETEANYSNIKDKDAKIFISHSSKNKEIVSKFCDLILNNGLNINTVTEVFNTSLEGSKPKTGEDFRERIKKALVNAKIVFQFISKEYKESEVCLNEMGAAWVLSENVYPLIIEENNYDVGFIHNTNQQVQLNKKEQIFKLIDDLRIANIISIENFSIERLNEKINEFVDWFKTHQKSQLLINSPLINKNISIKESTNEIIYNLNKDKNPFYKINKRASVYYLSESKFCLIPDNLTLLFLGYKEFNKANQISIDENEFKSKIGNPIISITRGAIYKDEQSNEYWLIYDNKRHMIDAETYSALNRENPAIKNITVNRNQLLQIIEGDYFSMK